MVFGEVQTFSPSLLSSVAPPLSPYLIVKILRALEDASTHLHDRGDRNQEGDDPHDGADLRKRERGKKGGRRGRERQLSVLLSISIF